MKKFILICLIAIQGLYAQTLDLTETSEHFSFHFSKADVNIIPNIISDLENFYASIPEELSYSRDNLIQVNIYPDIETFHSALNLTNAPDWDVANACEDTDSTDFVSPNNPGPYHTAERIFKIMKLNIIKLNICKRYDNIPYWLQFGVGAMLADYTLRHPIKHVPSLTEMEEAATDCIAFDKIQGWQAAYLFTKFVRDTHGWNTLANLLSNYDLYKEDLYQEWIQSIQGEKK